MAQPNEKKVAIMVAVQTDATVTAAWVDNVDVGGRVLEVKRAPGQRQSVVLNSFNLPDPKAMDLYEAELVVTVATLATAAQPAKSRTDTVFISYVSDGMNWNTGETIVAQEELPYVEFTANTAAVTMVLTDRFV